MPRQDLLARLAALCALALLAFPATAEPMRIVVFGDSLSAGLGLTAPQAFPARLEAALKAKGYDVRIENAGVSGDTASAGLARLEWSVREGTAAVILELGANDALRGVPPAVTKNALDAIVRRLKERNIEVLIAGMRAPPNLGAAYTRTFDAIFPEIAKTHGVALYPFFLDGVAAEPKLNLPDGIHPTADGIAVIVERILPAVEALIERAKTRKG
jgi:acyl-CoA thioesterase-1